MIVNDTTGSPSISVNVKLSKLFLQAESDIRVGINALTIRVKRADEMSLDSDMS